MLIIFLNSNIVYSSWSDNINLFTSIWGGVSKGGIMDDVEIDGLTTATKTGGNAGLGIGINYKIFSLGTSIDYFRPRQDITYNNVGGTYTGIRTLRSDALYLPVIFGFHTFKGKGSVGSLIFSLGFGKLFIWNTLNNIGYLPDNTIKNTEYGLTFNLEYLPFSFFNFGKQGFYLHMYRGIPSSENDNDRFFNETYFKKTGTGDMTSFNFGLMVIF